MIDDDKLFMYPFGFVLVPPTIQEGERVVHVKENTSMTLECIVSGVPTPKLNWKRDGVSVVVDEHYQLTADGQRLTILDAKQADVGRFTCEGIEFYSPTSIDDCCFF